MIELRRAICDYVGRHYGVNYQPESEVLVTVGVSEAIDVALRALVNPGDQVMFHQPCYVSYHPSVTLTHGTGVAVPTHAADNFALTATALAAAWRPGCKVLMLNLPCNPTGGTCSREQLEHLLVISDEIYSELTFEGGHVSIGSLPGMQERTIFLHGFSKAFAMTGWRIGYACGPAPLIDAMMKVHQYSMMCASIISQEAAIEALLRGEDGVKRMREQYHRRRDLVVRRFNEIGLKCHLPRGSFYAFPSVAAGRAGVRVWSPREGTRGDGARHSLRRERPRIRARQLRDRLRETRRGLQPHRTVCARFAPVGRKPCYSRRKTEDPRRIARWASSFLDLSS